MQWEHAFLHRLSSTGFPASRPVPALAGRSWLRHDERVWGTLSYLPGRSLFWERRPGLDAVGAFVADYHRAARLVPLDSQRPTGVPLARLADLTPWDRLTTALGSRERIGRLESLVQTLDGELRSLDLASFDQIVIHGDCIVDNILIDGTPPQIVALIDFGNAFNEIWLADLGAGLYRSGRAHPDDVGLDAHRVARFVAGYHQRSRLTPRQACAVPMLIKARGLQLVVRWVSRASPAEMPALTPVLQRTLDRASWVQDHQAELEDAVGAIIA